MTLALFILGILIIFGIARYNESNKLFWTLLFAYTIGFAGTKVLYDTFKEKKQSETTLNQACPIQGLIAAGNTIAYFKETACDLTPTKVTSNLVGQVYTPDTVERNNTLSCVSGVTQGRNFKNLPNPPNGVIMFDTS